MTPYGESLKAAVEEMGWTPGSSFENRVAYRLHRYGWGPDVVAQEYRAGRRYRLDFAWPDLMIGLEVDGWWHRSPEGAARDAARDAWLRTRGWVIFRIDDRDPSDAYLELQVARVTQIVGALRDRGCATDWGSAAHDARTERPRPPVYARTEQGRRRLA